MTRVDSPVPLMHHDPDRSWITDPDPDHPKGRHPMTAEKKNITRRKNIMHACAMNSMVDLVLAKTVAPKIVSRALNYITRIICHTLTISTACFLDALPRGLLFLYASPWVYFLRNVNSMYF